MLYQEGFMMFVQNVSVLTVIDGDDLISPTINILQPQ